MVIDFEPAPILERVNYFRNSTESNETTYVEQLPIRMNKEWDIDAKHANHFAHHNRIIEKSHSADFISSHYDERFIFYHDALVARRTSKT